MKKILVTGSGGIGGVNFVRALRATDEEFFLVGTDFNKYYLDNPFKQSCLALYNWAPIADELKTLDKEIVLNSMRLKWNLKIDEFKKLTKNLNFN